MRAIWLLIGMTVSAVSCGTSTGLDAPVVDRPVADQDQAIHLTLEEAGHFASGQLFSIYGADAHPVPIRVEGEVVEHQGQLVWRLDITTSLTDSGELVEHQWRMWVGTPSDGPPGVLRAQRRLP